MGHCEDFVPHITCIGPTIPPTRSQLSNSPHPQRTRRRNPRHTRRRRLHLLHRRLYRSPPHPITASHTFLLSPVYAEFPPRIPPLPTWPGYRWPSQVPLLGP